MSPARCIKQSFFILGMALATMQAAPSVAQTESALEAKVKAAYLFHLTKFVDWPSLPPEVLHICVLGADPVGDMLLELTDRKVKEHALKIELNARADLAQCQVLFISRSEKKWGDVLARLHSASVLTVSDHQDFAQGGGVIGFYSEDGKIKLEINPVAARNANLKINSKLMEMARTVPFR